MKKRLLSLLLAATMVLSLLSAAAFAAEVTAAPSPATVLLDGKKVAFEAYAINSNNYFKLRDLAMAFNGTSRQFNVGYSNGMVEITTGSPYTPVGGELSPGSGAAVAARPGNAEVFFTRENYKISMGAYAIGGNNFVKLRDLMQWLNVSVGYDSATATITLDTGKPYVLPMAIDNPLAGQSAVDNKTRADYGGSPGAVNNRLVGVNYKGYYYALTQFGAVLRIKEDGSVKQSFQLDPKYVYSRLQVYNDKIIVEGQPASGMSWHDTFSMNLDGSGLKTLWSGGLSENGHGSMVYKGKIYSAVYTESLVAQVVSHDLNGGNKKVVYQEDGARKVTWRTISLGQREHGIQNVFAIYNDRMYLLEAKQEGGKGPYEIISLNLDGGDRQTVGTIGVENASIQNVYDGYLYFLGQDPQNNNTLYDVNLYRSKLDGSDVRCVLPSFAANGNDLTPRYFVNYGDKIIFSTPDQILGVVNNDGSNRRQMPNSPKGVGGSVLSAAVMNENYTMAELSYNEKIPTVLLRNSAATPGHVFLCEGEQNAEGKIPAIWRDVAKPFATGKETAQKTTGKPADGVYFILSAQNDRFALDMGNNTQAWAPIFFDVADGRYSQKIKLANAGDNQYTMTMVRSERLLRTTGEQGKEITQTYDKAGDPRQIFTFTDQGDGTYRIQDNTGLYLAAAGGAANQGQAVCLWTKVEEAGQRFILQRVAE